MTCGPKKVPWGARSKNRQSDLIEKSLSEGKKKGLRRTKKETGSKDAGSRGAEN